MRKTISPGPITNNEGIPYDYIVIVDSGSKGLRVYVYNWLNPQIALERGYSFHKPLLHTLHEVRHNDLKTRARTDDKVPGEGIEESDSDSESESEPDDDVLFPKVATKKHWHRKIKPGISSFNLLPHKIGKHHMKYLVNLAMGVVPTLQHSRTPVFVHLTAGMRLLPPTEQQDILDEICAYLQRKSPFYIPECLSHVNVLNGDVEGIYGWLLVNSLMGAFDHPTDHDHGKNHSTYGLLDMGGALTQVVFLPNTTEIEEHQNNLYRVELKQTPIRIGQKGDDGKKKGEKSKGEESKGDKGKGEESKGEKSKGDKGKGEKSKGEEGEGDESKENADADGKKENQNQENQNDNRDLNRSTREDTSQETSQPDPIQSDSSSTLESTSSPQYDPPEETSYYVYSDSFLGFGMYQAHNRYLSSLVTAFATEHNIDLLGKPRIRMPVSDPCLPKGYATHAVVDDVAVSFVGESDFSRCLQNIFPVLVNSTYAAGTSALKSPNCKQHLAEDEIGSCLLNDLIPLFDFDVNHFMGVSGYWDAINRLLGPGALALAKYDYRVIYNKTSTVCSEPFSLLIELNSAKSGTAHMQEDDLAELCFKSSWILNFLHLGLGFPRFGIDETKSDKYGALLLVEDFDGQSFSWTLGRAMLYANDEYVQAYNNYLDTNVKRPGFFHSALESIFHYGAEQNGVPPRPQFDLSTVTKTSLGTYIEDLGNELTWYIHPHRWYGISIFAVLIVFIGVLMLGRQGRKRVTDRVKLMFSRSPTYEVVPEYELNTIDGLFKVDDEP